jgi:hypothetical protein
MATILSTNSARGGHHSIQKNITEQVYSIILQRSGRVRAVDLDKIFGNKKKVRSAITRLTVEGKIKRIRGFGKSNKIEYFYVDTRHYEVAA